jgi:hypothetical protein
LNISTALAGSREQTVTKGLGGQVYIAFAVGWAITLMSLLIGNIYTISLMVMPVAVWATLKWQRQPLPWIALVSILAANPANSVATVALNLIFVVCFIALNLRTMEGLPHWIYLVCILGVISAVASMVNWGETGKFSSQCIAIINYILGPFVLLPFTFYRLKNLPDSTQLLKVFILALLVPSVTLLLAAWFLGSPVLAFNASADDLLGKVWTYKLINTDISLLRTQVGMMLAAMACAAFAIIMCDVAKWVRLMSIIILLALLFLLLATGSVGSTLSALLSLAFLLAVAARYLSVRKYLLVLPVVITVGAVGWSQLPDEIKEYAESRYDRKVAEGIDLSDRSGLWKGSALYLLKNPLGRGWSLYVEPLGYYPHNDYISYGISFGVISGLLYLFLPVAIILSMVFSGCDGKDGARLALFLAGIGAISVVFVNSFSDHLTGNRWYFNVTWSIIWYCYFASRAQTLMSKYP